MTVVDRIVKVQMPLISTAQEPEALLYDQSRGFEEMIPITDELLEKMKDRAKAFFRVRTSEHQLNETLLVVEFLEEVDDPGW